MQTKNLSIGAYIESLGRTMMLTWFYYQKMKEMQPGKEGIRVYDSTIDNLLHRRQIREQLARYGLKTDGECRQALETAFSRAYKKY